jgi:hypothetical protein
VPEVPTPSFQVIDVHFNQEGVVELNYRYDALEALPAKVDNVDAFLTWGLSFDGGQSYYDIAYTSLKFWVVLDAPRAFNPLTLPCCRYATARRIDQATTDLRNTATAGSAATMENHG